MRKKLTVPSSAWNFSVVIIFSIVLTACGGAAGGPSPASFSLGSADSISTQSSMASSSAGSSASSLDQIPVSKSQSSAFESLSVLGSSSAIAPANSSNSASSQSGINDGMTTAGSGYKPYPQGVYESAGPIRFAYDNSLARTPKIPGQDGVLVRVAWNLCGDDQDCLFDTIQTNLDTAAAMNLKVALAVLDGNNAPPAVKAACTLFNFTFRNESSSMCLVWDQQYITDKSNFVAELGRRFDSHPALAYVYFTGACSTNGVEGHCRIDTSAYTSAGYTATKFKEAYATIMQSYENAFPTTPIVFEVHTLFSDPDIWQSVWNKVANSGRVGVAAWWCSERLSLAGHDTEQVWPIVQDAATKSFAVCQTLSNFSSEPYQFSDTRLGLNYGTQSDWNAADADRAFSETLDWIEGLAVHAQQSSTIVPFRVAEMWTQDLLYPGFQNRLANYLDED